MVSFRDHLIRFVFRWFNCSSWPHWRHSTCSTEREYHVRRVPHQRHSRDSFHVIRPNPAGHGAQDLHGKLQPLSLAPGSARRPPGSAIHRSQRDRVQLCDCLGKTKYFVTSNFTCSCKKFSSWSGLETHKRFSLEWNGNSDRVCVGRTDWSDVTAHQHNHKRHIEHNVERLLGNWSPWSTSAW